jgi:hypothetical protein
VQQQGHACQSAWAPNIISTTLVGPDRYICDPLQASRRQWAELARHCRMHGGDRAYERHGASLRYGIGVPLEQHAAYLAHAGLQPETGADG